MHWSISVKKGRYQESLFSQTILRTFNKGSLPQRKVFFAFFVTNSVTFIGKCFLAALSSPQNNKRNGQRFIVEYSSLTFQVSGKVCKTEIFKTKVISVISILL